MSQQVNETPKRRIRKPRFTTLIVAGIVLGVIWGLFFGEYGSWLKWVGDVFVGLLQMTVLPYVAFSLICSVGRLSVNQGGRLARVAFFVLVLLWVIGLITLGLMRFSFPLWDGGSFFCTSLIDEPAKMDWLGLFIPSNPFWSLANNVVPAVVLFSIGLGIALIPVPNKEPLLEKLDVLLDALGRLNKLVVRMSPLGMFAIVGHTAGTISLERLSLLQGYLLVYGAAALLLSLWILPALIACCTRFSHREILAASRDVLIASFVIGNTFVVLPMIVDAIKRLSEKHVSDGDDSLQVPEYTVQLAYPFPDLGRIVGLIFIPFAAWFYGTTVDAAKVPQLIGIGFVGAFAKPVVTIPMLLDLAEIPADIFNLFLASGVIASRFGDMMKTMHLFTFSILTASFLSGVARVKLTRLITNGVTTFVVLAVTVVAIRSYLVYSFHDEYSKEKLLVARPLVGEPVEATVLNRSEPNPDPIAEGEDYLDRIRRRGTIRIGINTDKLPFSYYNRNGQLVGFDIDMAHQLAHDLRVRIEFVPFATGMTELLRKDHFDIAMSGLEGTIKRAELPEMEHYLKVSNALVVPDVRRHQFRSLAHLAAELRGGEPLRVAVVAGNLSNERRANETSLGTAIGAIKNSGLLQYVEWVELTSAAEFFQSEPPVADVLATSAEEGAAWTLKYPQFSVVRPPGLKVETPLYYFVAERSRFREFIDNWLKLKRDDGTIQRLYDYWILGRDDESLQPRWCILRDVLHWVR